MSQKASVVFGMSIGFGLGRAFVEWPGGLWASGLGLALAITALIVVIRDARQAGGRT